MSKTHDDQKIKNSQVSFLVAKNLVIFKKSHYFQSVFKISIFVRKTFVMGNCFQPPDAGAPKNKHIKNSL